MYQSCFVEMIIESMRTYSSMYSSQLLLQLYEEATTWPPRHSNDTYVYIYKYVYMCIAAQKHECIHGSRHALKFPSILFHLNTDVCINIIIKICYLMLSYSSIFMKIINNVLITFYYYTLTEYMHLKIF